MSPVGRNRLRDIDHSKFVSREVFVGSDGALGRSVLQNVVFFAGKDFPTLFVKV